MHYLIFFACACTGKIYCIDFFEHYFKEKGIPVSFAMGTEWQKSKTWVDETPKCHFQIYTFNRVRLLGWDHKPRWMAARNFTVFGTDNPVKHLWTTERMPKQIRDGNCSTLLSKEFTTCLEFLKGWSISWIVQTMNLVLSPMKSTKKVMGKPEYS